MNLSIEDLEAIKAIVREVVKVELARVIEDAQVRQAAYAESMRQQAEAAQRVSQAKEAAAAHRPTLPQQPAANAPGP